MSAASKVSEIQHPQPHTTLDTKIQFYRQGVQYRSNQQWPQFGVRFGNLTLGPGLHRMCVHLHLTLNWEDKVLELGEGIGVVGAGVGVRAMTEWKGGLGDGDGQEPSKEG